VARNDGTGMMNWGYGAGWLMGIFNIVFWVVLIIAIVYFIKWLSASSRQGGYEKRGTMLSKFSGNGTRRVK